MDNGEIFLFYLSMLPSFSPPLYIKVFGMAVRACFFFFSRAESAVLCLGLRLGGKGVSKSELRNILSGQNSESTGWPQRVFEKKIKKSYRGC